MKASEMPKKIYLFDYNDAMVTPIEGDTVYVREDAFIEKACQFLSEKCDLCIYEEFDPENRTYYINYDKIIEDFKKYMKGE